MAPPPAKKIRLTFLWADHAAVEQDFGQDYSKKLVDWASKFYKRHGFELDVAPKPGDRDEAYRYALVKENGYAPDIATAEELIGIYSRAVKPFSDELQKVREESDELFKQIFDNQRETRDALQKFGTLPPAAWPAQAVKLTSAFGSLALNTVAHELKEKRWLEVLDEIRTGVDALYAFEKRAQDFDVPVRLAIGDKVIESVDLSAAGRQKTGKENPAIWSESRLKVIFCRFQLSPGLAQASGPQPHGIAAIRTRPANSVNGRYLFGGPIILINILRPERITLAHEMVHAAGRRHRPDFDRMKDIFTILQAIRLQGGKIVLPDFFERVRGGYHDGPADDIINYNSKGKDPDKVTLYDKELMAKAFFVKTQP